MPNVNFEQLIARVERGAVRRLPAPAVVAFNARLHRLIGEPELAELRRLVRPASAAIDVGGHFGTYTHALARHVGRHGRVVTFEPIAEDAELIRRAARWLRLPVHVICAAVSNRAGEAELTIPRLGTHEKTALATLEGRPQTDRASALESRCVPVVRLDDALADMDLQISFVKIDVEGHEMAVLAGARATLARHRPNLLIEINHDVGPNSIDTVFAAVEDLGYRGEFLEGGRFRRPLSAFDVGRHQAGNDVLSRSYVNNFIFLPA